jgi:hypothetical protein
LQISPHSKKYEEEYVIEIGRKNEKTKIGTILAWDVCLILGTIPQNLG